MRSAEETEAAGAALARTLRPGAKVLLVGPLGAGKTTFIRGVARALGATIDVTSPTFTLIHEYDTARGTLYHVDLYRIDDSAELEETGFYEIWGGPDTALVEWGDKLPADLRREADVEIDLSMDGAGRRLRIARGVPRRNR